MYDITVVKKQTLNGHRDAVYTICPSTQPDRFFSAGGDGMVAEWEIEGKTDGELIAKVTNSVYALQLIPESNRLIVGQNYQGIHIIDILTRKETGSLKLTDAAIFDIKRFDKYLIVGTGSGELLLIDLMQMKLIKQIKSSNQSVRTISVGKKHLAVGYSDNFIRIFNLPTFEKILEIEAHKNSVFNLIYNQDSTFLLSGSRDAHLKIWDVMDNYHSKESIAAHMYTINSIDFRPDQLFFATASVDKTIKIWDTMHSRLLKVIDYARHGGHTSSVNKIFWSNYKNRLISCSDDRSISVWDIKFNTQP